MKLKQFISSKYFPLIFIPIAFLFSLIYSWATSPLFLGDDFDSSIFKTIGLGIAQGKLPYVDLFDHKGGLFFLIQSLGWILPWGRWGLFIVQICFLSTTLALLFQTSCLLLDKAKAFGATMCCLMLNIIFIESGNQCESFMLPFTALTLFLSIKYLLNKSQDKHPILYSLVYGICFAAVFWIRPNDAVSQIGAVMAGIFFLLLYRKQYRNAIANASVFLVGCAIVTLPLVGFFAYHGCVYELLNGTFLFNLRYVSDSGMPSAMTTLGPLAIFGTIIWISLREQKSALNFIFTPMLVLTLLLIGKREYGHYLIIMVVPAIILFSYLIKARWNIALCIVLVAVAGLSIRQHKYVFKSITEHSGLEEFYAQTRRIIGNVPESERDMIWNLNLTKASNKERPNIYTTLSAFVDAGITPCNRVFVIFHLYAFPESETVIANMPKWILADPTAKSYGDYADFLEQHYTIVDETDKTCVGDITLYKIKDADR